MNRHPAQGGRERVAERRARLGGAGVLPAAAAVRAVLKLNAGQAGAAVVHRRGRQRRLVVDNAVVGRRGQGHGRGGRRCPIDCQHEVLRGVHADAIVRREAQSVAGAVADGWGTAQNAGRWVEGHAARQRAVFAKRGHRCAGIHNREAVRAADDESHAGRTGERRRLIDHDAEALGGGAADAVAASTTPLNVPNVVGVPEIRPAALSVRPLGNVPEPRMSDGLGAPVAVY